jgi:hypothetical protein
MFASPQPRTWQIRVTFTRTYPHPPAQDYHELTFADHREAYRFALDWFTEDPTVHRLTVVDSAGRRDPVVFTNRHLLEVTP